MASSVSRRRRGKNLTQRQPRSQRKAAAAFVRIGGDMDEITRLRFAVPGAGEVSAILVQPGNARWLLVLAHGAGAGMTHPFMEKLAGGTAGGRGASFSYQFSYMEQKEKGAE